MNFAILDIGSYQIKSLVAELNRDGKLSLRDIFKEISTGIRRGEIIDNNDVIASLEKIFKRIKENNRLALKNVFVNVGGSNIRCQNSKGIVAVSRAYNEISQEDIDRVVKASQAIKLPPNRMIMHAITQEFVVDGIGDIREPLGMNGTRLEVNSLIIDAFSPNVKNILNTLEKLGASVSGLIYNPLAASRSVLTKHQKDLGTVLIDIGFGTTSMSVYEECKLLHIASFPIGSGNITRDLAIGLKCSMKLAELIKIVFGRAITNNISNKEKITAELIEEKSGIDVADLDKNFKANISSRFVAEIIESRLSEIFELINGELKAIHRFGQLPGGAIICGGGGKKPGI